LTKTQVAYIACNCPFKWATKQKGSTVEGDTARGTTTLVYLQLHISLDTGTVHVLSRVAGIHPLV
jgi:hypothetical protein